MRNSIPVLESQRRSQVPFDEQKEQKLMSSTYQQHWIITFQQIPTGIVCLFFSLLYLIFCYFFRSIQNTKKSRAENEENSRILKESFHTKFESFGIYDENHSYMICILELVRVDWSDSGIELDHPWRNERSIDAATESTMLRLSSERALT